ncbi:MAG: ribosome maturation factor RimP [Blastococcus sp.]
MSASRGTQRTDPATSKLAGWIGPVVAEAGYDLEELVVTPAGRRSVVRVVVDRDTGVTLDDIAEVSRAVSEVLDTNDDGMGRTPYVLEVTSPGVDRPLTEARHWRRNTGRLVTVAVGSAGSAEEVTGRITAVTDRGVELAVGATGKPGAKKRPPTPRLVPWAEVGAGRVQVEFGRPEAGHDDIDHIDEIDGDDEDIEIDSDEGTTPQARGGGL